VRPGAGLPPDLNDRINVAIPTIFPNEGREYGAASAHSTFWGGQGYSNLVDAAPWHNSQDLFILKEDYARVFGKHLIKAGALGSFNRKNEDIGGGSFENSEFWGSTGLNGSGATTGNIIADILLKDMTFGFDENSAGRQLPERWADLEFYVGDSWKLSPDVTLDYGVRYSKFFNPYAADNRLTNFNPDVFDPALGADPCNGLLIPPGTDWCRQAGFASGTPGPNGSLHLQDNNNVAPRLGIAWNVAGKGKTVIRGAFGQFFAHENLAALTPLGRNPPFVSNINGMRKLDTAEEPCPGCFGTTSLAQAGSGHVLTAATPNNWHWNLTVQHEIASNTTLDVSYVGNKGNNLRRAYDANQVRTGDINGNGVDDRLEYARAPSAEVRPYGVLGDRALTIWDHQGYSTYHALQAQLASRFGRSQLQGSYTWSRTISTDPLDDFFGGSVTDLDSPDLDRGPARAHRTHVFNASLILQLPTLQSKSRLWRNALGNWEIAGIAAAATGTPVTIIAQAIPGLSGGVSGSGRFEQRPNRVAGESCRPRSSPPEQSINPKAFTLADFQIGSPGNSGAGVCEGPGFLQTDLALYKNIRASEKVRLQFRMEVFNVFNRTNFMFVNNVMNPTAVTFDTPDVVDATRITSFVLPANFGQATAARDPRQAQVGVRVIF
jgi:hypothetical protein